MMGRDKGIRENLPEDWSCCFAPDLLGQILLYSGLIATEKAT